MKEKELAVAITLIPIVLFFYLFPYHLPKIIAAVSFAIVILLITTVFFAKLLHWGVTKLTIISDDPDYYEPVASSTFMEKLLSDLKNRLSGIESERIEKKFKACFIKELIKNLNKINYILIKRFLLFSFVSVLVFSFIGFLFHTAFAQLIHNLFISLFLSFVSTLASIYLFSTFFIENLDKYIEKD